MARVVFLGTPEAAVPALDSLTQRHEIPLVVTQPDRTQGRSKRPVPSPVKRLASAKGLTVAQPEDRSELAKQFEDHGPFDVGVVVAYGRILRPEILEAPDRGLLNAHFSLLPRWRGAAPVARALMAGDAMTGVTIMKLDEGLDTGPILTAQAIDIPPGVDAGQLTESLAKVFISGRVLGACSAE
jgi:methionyl-tRNA formyltransferase